MFTINNFTNKNTVKQFYALGLLSNPEIEFTQHFRRYNRR